MSKIKNLVLPKATDVTPMVKAHKVKAIVKQINKIDVISKPKLMFGQNVAALI